MCSVPQVQIQDWLKGNLKWGPIMASLNVCDLCIVLRRMQERAYMGPLDLPLNLGLHCWQVSESSSYIDVSFIILNWVPLFG